MKRYVIDVNGVEYNVAIAETTNGGVTIIETPAIEQKVDNATAKTTSIPNAEGKNILAPMPGTVLKVLKKDGKINQGEVVILLEAMKMENEIISNFNGTISTFVNEGDKINTGDIIAVVK